MGEITKKEATKQLSEKVGIEKQTDGFGKDDKIKWMLGFDKKPFKCFSVGEHNDHYYFGTILDYGRKKVPVIILDNGQTFWKWSEKDDEGNKTVDDEIRNKFGLNYRFELFDDCVDNLWSNKSMKEFIMGKSDKKSFVELFKKIRDKNKEVMYFPDERVHSFVAVDIIKSYFYQLFNACGRTYFQADFGSGKSRQSLIYQKLSFNSLFAANISPASFERVIESTGGTLIVDNFDNIADDLKKQILQCIEVYYKKGGKNIKADGKGSQKNQPIAFNGYSPLIINNIIGLPEVTESRCNKVQLLKTSDKSVVDVRINEKDPFWEDVKNDLHILALQQWKKVRETYDNLEVPELSARELERAEAVLTIAKIIGDDVYKNILEFLITTSEQQGMKEVHDNWEFILFEILHTILKDKKVENIKIAEITECAKAQIVTSDKTEKTDKLKFSHYCGKILGNIVLFKKKMISGYVHYEIKKKSLDKMLEIKGFTKYMQQPHLTTPNNTNNTIQHQPHHTKKQCFQKEKGVVGVVGVVKRVPINSGNKVKNTRWKYE